MTSPRVAILMGSDSDLSVMKEAAALLDRFSVAYEIKVLSAHRSPRLVTEYVSEGRKKGLKVFICGAGGAAHLAGVVAAHTILPVIGVPIDSSPLKGLDALLATVQMPAGIPVATVAIGGAGARNAALLAVQMMALEDTALQAKLDAYKKDLEDGVRKKNEGLKEKIGAKNS